MPRGRAREHQVGDVRAADQQDEADRGQHDEQIAAQIRAHVFHVNREDIHSEAGILSRVLFGQTFSDRVHLRARLFQGNVVAEPAVDLHFAAVSLDRILGRGRIVRHPELGRMLILSFARGGQMKFRREDANDCVGNVIQSERLPESGSLAAEMIFEKGVAQHHHMALGRVGRRGIKTRSQASVSRRRG